MYTSSSIHSLPACFEFKFCEDLKRFRLCASFCSSFVPSSLIPLSCRFMLTGFSPSRLHSYISTRHFLIPVLHLVSPILRPLSSLACSFCPFVTLFLFLLLLICVSFCACFSSCLVPFEYRSKCPSSFGPLCDGMVVTGFALGFLVRISAINANRAVRYAQPGYTRSFSICSLLLLLWDYLCFPSFPLARITIGFREVMSRHSYHRGLVVVISPIACSLSLFSGPIPIAVSISPTSFTDTQFPKHLHTSCPICSWDHLFLCPSLAMLMLQLCLEKEARMMIQIASRRILLLFSIAD